MSFDVWTGIGLKLDHAEFHLQKMADALKEPERTPRIAALESSGAIIDTGWQRALYAYFDAFLMSARCVPELIQCCLGHDQGRQVQAWFSSLSVEEQDRRKRFRSEFAPAYDSFRDLPLSNTRHVIEHRSGVPPITVETIGAFGVVHAGGPINRIPISEARTDVPEELAFLIKHRPIRPMWSDFKINGDPLFEVCHGYQSAAGELVARAREVSLRVHGSASITPPPTA